METTAVRKQDRARAYSQACPPGSPEITCPRCCALMVSEYCIDMPNGSGELEFLASRCVQCGEIIDPVILRNRRTQRSSWSAPPHSPDPKTPRHHESTHRGEDKMTARHLTHICLMAAWVFYAGCATDLTQSPNRGPSGMRPGFVTQDQARDLAFTYRQQAREMSQLARRLELESSLSSHELAPAREESRRRLAQVKQLLVAAEEADELARTYRRQVPHGQVQ
jgi:hypothetical protein